MAADTLLIGVIARHCPEVLPELTTCPGDTQALALHVLQDIDVEADCRAALKRILKPGEYEQLVRKVIA